MNSHQLNKRSAGIASAATFPERVEGRVQSVDLLGREIAVQLPTGREVFYVPPDCPTYLRGERVKLRIAQARDEVRVTFERGREGLWVKMLEIL